MAEALSSFFESSAILHAVEVDGEGIILDVNPLYATRLKVDRARLVGTPLAGLICPEDRSAAVALQSPPASATIRFLDAEGVVVPLDVVAVPSVAGALLLGEPAEAVPYLVGDDLFAHANELAVQARERSRNARKLTRALEAHESEHWHLQRDRDVLPICVGCSRIRTIDGHWETIQEFLNRSSDFLSHTWCEECATKFGAA